jgi:hypothetical protein
MRYCAIGGIASVGLVIFTLLWQRPAGIRLLVLFISALAGITAFYLPYRQAQIAARVPPIHDITTDIANPPQFVAVVPLRAGAPNPPEYLGGETSALQRQFYMINLIFVLLTDCRQHLVYSMNFAQIFFYLIDTGWILYVNVSYLMIDHSEGLAVFEVDEFITAYLPNV